VKIEPGSTNMQTRAGQKVGGVLTPGPHRDWRHCYAWLILKIRSALCHTVAKTL